MPTLLLFGILLANPVSPPELVLDDFTYAGPAAARAVWVAAEGTPPVEVAARQADTVPAMVVRVPFASSRGLGRAVVDRRLTVDLATPGEFALDVAADNPAAFGEITLYFRSGRGWYAAHAALVKKGWQTLRFSKASFRTEETPTGWQKIDGVRIAAWRGQAKDASLSIRRLTALTHDVAIVIPPTAAAGSEHQAAMQTASLVADMLEELGLGSDAVDDDALVNGALGSRRAAVLAYHPRLGSVAEAALVRYVEDGGKLLVCYNLPGKLGGALGFGKPRYVREERHGHLAEIRFDASDIEGLPAAGVRQASWNITAADPVKYNARVIARWFDDAGKPTGQPAMLLSDRGAFFTHIILSDDPTGKRQVLAAVLGQLAPPLWQRMARAELRRAANVGAFSETKELSAYVTRRTEAKPPVLDPKSQAAALAALDVGQRRLQEAANAYQESKYSLSTELSRRAHSRLVEAYLAAQSSPDREGRAMWNHSGTGAYPGDWERTAKLLHENGFNMVLPNMLWGGLAHYPSTVLPQSETFRRYGDQIEQCVAAARKHGIEVHVWKVNFNLSTAPKDFIEKLRRAGRTQVDAHGHAADWLCPSHPENRQLELDSMLEVAKKYAVAGLHFDYIRYPGHESCYCAGCRRRFEADSAKPVAAWPGDCYRGVRKDEYNDWRCRQITALVSAVSAEARKARPGLKISAAVFGAYPSCRESVAQDWPAWIKAGYLDFVCPMDYTTSELQFSSLVEDQLRLVGGRVPIYPGIGATASRSALSADRVVSQLEAARRLGAAGFTIFNLDRGTAESIVPGVGLGAGRRPAQPPHVKE